MTITVNSTAEHRRDLDRVSEAEIEAALKQTLQATATHLSETLTHASDDPEAEAAYREALLRFGIAAAAKYEYKEPRSPGKSLVPNWIRGARIELISQKQNNPHQSNLLQTPFFSPELSVLEELNRSVHAFVQETENTPALSARQFAAEIALFAAMTSPEA